MTLSFFHGISKLVCCAEPLQVIACGGEAAEFLENRAITTFACVPACGPHDAVLFARALQVIACGDEATGLFENRATELRHSQKFIRNAKAARRDRAFLFHLARILACFEEPCCRVPSDSMDARWESDF